MTLGLTSEETALYIHLFVWRVGNGTMLGVFEGRLDLCRMERRDETRFWPSEANFQRRQIRPSWRCQSRRRSQIGNLRDLKGCEGQGVQDPVPMYILSMSFAKSASEVGLPPRRRIFTL